MCRLVGSATVPVVGVDDAAVAAVAVEVTVAGGMGEATPSTLPCSRDVNEDRACPIGFPN